jgi:hypothetical protein
MNQVTGQQKFDMRTDVYSIGEVKKKYNKEHKKNLYAELTGKIAFILEVLDSWIRQLESDVRN